MKTKAKTKTESLSIWAAKLAAKCAQEIGLPPGNLWEPGIVRHLEGQVRAGQSRDAVETLFAFQIGLSLARTKGLPCSS